MSRHHQDSVPPYRMNFAELIFVIRHLLAYMEDVCIWLPSGTGQFNQRDGVMRWSTTDFNPTDQRLAEKILEHLGRYETPLWWDGRRDITVKPRLLRQVSQQWHLRKVGWRRISMTQIEAAYDAMHRRRESRRRAEQYLCAAPAAPSDPDEFPPQPQLL